MNAPAPLDLTRVCSTPWLAIPQGMPAVAASVVLVQPSQAPRRLFVCAERAPEPPPEFVPLVRLADFGVKCGFDTPRRVLMLFVERASKARNALGEPWSWEGEVPTARFNVPRHLWRAVIEAAKDCNLSAELASAAHA